MSEERKKVWVDRFQTKLTLRIGGYLVIFLVVFCNFLFAWRLIEEGPIDPWEQIFDTIKNDFPVLIALFVLMPVMAWDTLRFSHRLVGPMIRFRKAMQAIAAGEAVRPIKLRDGDYLGEMRDDFNRMLEELQKQGLPVLKPADPDSEAEMKKKTA